MRSRSSISLTLLLTLYESPSKLVSSFQVTNYHPLHRHRELNRNKVHDVAAETRHQRTPEPKDAAEGGLYIFQGSNPTITPTSPPSQLSEGVLPLPETQEPSEKLSTLSPTENKTISIVPETQNPTYNYVATQTPTIRSTDTYPSISPTPPPTSTSTDANDTDDILSSTLCEINSDGLYGTSSASNIPILFDYELEIAFEGEDILETEILRDLEDAIIDDVAPVLLPSCRERLLRIRPGSLRQRMLQDNEEQRSLQVNGVDSMPYDKVDEESVCREPLNNDDNLCALINGGMTIYVDDQDSQSDIELIRGAALLVIKARMNEGAYNSGVSPYIKKVTFASNIISLIGESGTNPDMDMTPPKATESQTIRARGYIVIASCLALVLISLIAIRRKRPTNDDDPTLDERKLNELDNPTHQNANYPSDMSTSLNTMSITVVIDTDSGSSVASTLGSPTSDSDMSDEFSAAVSRIQNHNGDNNMPPSLLGNPSEDSFSAKDDEAMLFMGESFETDSYLARQSTTSSGSDRISVGAAVQLSATMSSDTEILYASSPVPSNKSTDGEESAATVENNDSSAAARSFVAVMPAAAAARRDDDSESTTTSTNNKSRSFIAVMPQHKQYAAGEEQGDSDSNYKTPTNEEGSQSESVSSTYFSPVENHDDIHCKYPSSKAMMLRDDESEVPSEVPEELRSHTSEPDTEYREY